jgi:hypothetical protein
MPQQFPPVSDIRTAGRDIGFFGMASNVPWDGAEPDSELGIECIHLPVTLPDGLDWDGLNVSLWTTPTPESVDDLSDPSEVYADLAQDFPEFVRAFPTAETFATWWRSPDNAPVILGAVSRYLERRVTYRHRNPWAE